MGALRNRGERTNGDLVRLILSTQFRGMTKEEIVRKVGYDRKTLLKHELGEEYTDLSKIQQLADAAGIGNWKALIKNAEEDIIRDVILACRAHWMLRTQYEHDVLYFLHLVGRSSNIGCVPKLSREHQRVYGATKKRDVDNKPIAKFGTPGGIWEYWCPRVHQMVQNDFRPREFKGTTTVGEGFRVIMFPDQDDFIYMFAVLLKSGQESKPTLL